MKGDILYTSFPDNVHFHPVVDIDPILHVALKKPMTILFRDHRLYSLNYLMTVP